MPCAGGRPTPKSFKRTMLGALSRAAVEQDAGGSHPAEVVEAVGAAAADPPPPPTDETVAADLPPAPPGPVARRRGKGGASK